MANVYKNANYKLATTDVTDIYTCPNNSRAIVKKIPIITPQTKVTLTNMITKKEYNSDAEALADVQDPNSNTKTEHIRRDVDITVESIPLGAATNIF